MCKGKFGACMCVPALIAKILLIVGGVNWGLVGVGMFMGSNLNLVNLIFGSMPTVEAIVYVVVGLSAVMSLIGCRCKTCSSCTCSVDSSAKTGDGMM